MALSAKFDAVLFFRWVNFVSFRWSSCWKQENSVAMNVLSG